MVSVSLIGEVLAMLAVECYSSDEILGVQGLFVDEPLENDHFFARSNNNCLYKDTFTSGRNNFSRYSTNTSKDTC